MTSWLARIALGFIAAALLALAIPQGRGPGYSPTDPNAPQTDVRLPNGKLQRDEILKAEHAQNIKDAALLTETAQQLQEDLDKNDYSVLSMSTLKKTDDIEKLVKKIRARLRHN